MFYLYIYSACSTFNWHLNKTIIRLYNSSSRVSTLQDVLAVQQAVMGWREQCCWGTSLHTLMVWQVVWGTTRHSTSSLSSSALSGCRALRALARRITCSSWGLLLDLLDLKQFLTCWVWHSWRVSVSCWVVQISLLPSWHTFSYLTPQSSLPSFLTPSLAQLPAARRISRTYSGDSQLRDEVGFNCKLTPNDKYLILQMLDSYWHSTVSAFLYLFSSSVPVDILKGHFGVDFCNNSPIKMLTWLHCPESSSPSSLPLLYEGEYHHTSPPLIYILYICQNRKMFASFYTEVDWLNSQQ